jgi:UDP:flavonoid glycosyltransferase YjiC (YdhE family)
MGHVSRCIGLVNQLISQENSIYIACDEEQQQIFECYFYNLTFIRHTGYPFRFSGKGNFTWDLFVRYFALTTRMKKERDEVSSYVLEHSIDIVLSDHRYGFRCKLIPSVFITHQFNLPTRWYEFMALRWHRRLIQSFRTIWVMDTDRFQFAGDLSRGKSSDNVKYIGPYSRFMLYDVPKEKIGGTVLIVSGPSIYAQQLLDSFLNKNEQEDVIIVADKRLNIPKELLLEDRDWRIQDQAILRAQKVISRSGYSTIMDLHFLKCDAELYATKGQREQEYLLLLHALR